MKYYPLYRDEFEAMRKKIALDFKRQQHCSYYQELFEQNLERQIHHLSEIGMENYRSAYGIDEDWFQHICLYYSGSYDTLFEASAGIPRAQMCSYLYANEVYLNIMHLQGKARQKLKYECMERIVTLILGIIMPIAERPPVGLGYWLDRTGYHRLQLQRVCINKKKLVKA